MRGIKELNEKVDEILNDPKNYNKTIRIWRQRAKTGKLSLQKKIEIVEKFGANEIVITLAKPRTYATGQIKFEYNNRLKTILTSPEQDDNN